MFFHISEILTLEFLLHYEDFFHQKERFYYGGLTSGSDRNECNHDKLKSDSSYCYTDNSFTNSNPNILTPSSEY